MSHLILDQFETEPNVFYSGSYTDGLFIGSMGTSRGRFLVASANSGSNEILYVNYYSDYLDLSGSNRSRNLGNAHKFRSFTSSVERYQDTVLPDPYNAFLLNEGQPALAQGEMGLNPVIMNEPDAYAVVGQQPVGKLIYTTFGTTASYDTPSESDIQVADSVWIASSPFQGRYKDIQKVVEQSFYRTNIFIPVTESQRSFDNYYHYGPYTNSRPSSSLATLEVIIPRFVWQDGDPGGAGKFEPYRFTLMDVTGSTMANGKFGGLDVNLFPPATPTSFGVGLGTKRPTQKQLTKFLFGFGDNYQGVPIINAVTCSLLQTVVTSLGVVNGFYASSVDIRGWKYGVVNGFPFFTSCVFRSSRYGQFRDMLEQRKNTKFFDPSGFTANGKNNGKKGSSSAAVNVVFVSGSDSFVTASSPLTLNPNDSGIYDFEYKSGQPWHDL